MIRIRYLVHPLILLLLLAATHDTTATTTEQTNSHTYTRRPKPARTAHNKKEEKRPTTNTGGLKRRNQNPTHNDNAAVPPPEAAAAAEERDLLNIQSRVVGGNIVSDLNKHPFFAEWHGQFCGGALIHDDLVLTAAHCNNAGTLAPAVYFRNVERRQSGSVIRNVADHVAHPQYNAQFSTRDYDYLLLRLDKSALVDDYGNPTGVQTIAVNGDPNVPATGDALWGIGYGQVGEDIGGMSDQLRDATIFAFSDTRCENQYGQYYEDSYMFCSGVDGGGVDTCQGDSGGPIVHQATNTLVGIVSFGIGCARPNYAGVNSRVSAARVWLERAKCEFSQYPFCNGQYTQVTTPAPTPAPGNVNGGGNGGGNNNNNVGSVTITVVMDDYPEEVSWALIAQGAQTAMYFQPFDGNNVPGATDTQTFTDLAQGVTYLFKVSDAEGDGICCSYGSGSITIYDNVKNAEVWSSQGNYGSYYEVDFDILPNGHARVLKRSAHYQPSTWQDYEDQIAPTLDASWPGAMPVNNVSTIMVNVKTDDYPEEIKWTLDRKKSNSNSANNDPWELVQEWSGANSGFRQLVSTEVANLQQGWHRMVVRDTEGDGICCNYGSGYFSITGPIAVNNGRKGLIWGNDGLFWGMDEIFFHVDNSGYISHVAYSEHTTTAISRTMNNGPRITTAPSSAPSGAR